MSVTDLYQVLESACMPAVRGLLVQRMDKYGIRMCAPADGPNRLPNLHLSCKQNGNFCMDLVV